VIDVVCVHEEDEEGAAERSFALVNGFKARMTPDTWRKMLKGIDAFTGVRYT
jgi:hypothetical protein